MSVQTTFGTGYSASATSEQQVLMTSRRFAPDGTKTGIVYCHSTGALAPYGLFPTTNTSLAVPAIGRHLAECGWPILGADQGGDPFGNDTGTSRVEDCRTYLQSKGAKTGPVILLGWSEGGVVAMNYARVHPGNVAAMVLLQPASDLDNIWTVNPGTINARAKIDAAFPPGWTNSVAQQAFSPVNFASSLAGIPTLVFYSSDDSAVTASSVQAVIAGIGSSCTVGAVLTGDHGDGSLSKIDPQQIARWLYGLGL